MDYTENEISNLLKDITVELRKEVQYGEWDLEHADMLNNLTGTSSFQEEGILTYDEGFVLSTANGQRFQIAVKEW